MTTQLGKDSALLHALTDVQDPELHINIVDMGLIVDLRRTGGHVDIKMTFTAMGCPAMDMIMDDIRQRLLAEPDVNSVAIEVVWYPTWSKEWLSEDGKAAMREWGISV